MPVSKQCARYYWSFVIARPMFGFETWVACSLLAASWFLWTGKQVVLQLAQEVFMAAKVLLFRGWWAPCRGCCCCWSCCEEEEEGRQLLLGFLFSGCGGSRVSESGWGCLYSGCDALSLLAAFPWVDKVVEGLCFGAAFCQIRTFVFDWVCRVHVCLFFVFLCSTIYLCFFVFLTVLLSFILSVVWCWGSAGHYKIWLYLFVTICRVATLAWNLGRLSNTILWVNLVVSSKSLELISWKRYKHWGW